MAMACSRPTLATSRLEPRPPFRPERRTAGSERKRQPEQRGVGRGEVLKEGGRGASREWSWQGWRPFGYMLVV